MATDLSSVRTLVIAAVSALSGWAHSPFTPALFLRNTNQYAHHVFTVSILDTAPVSGDGQVLVDGMLAMSTVEVKWLHRIRSDAQSADYNAALDAEQALVAAVVGIASRHILIQRLAREDRAEGWVLGTATFVVQHRYTLA